MAPLPKHIVRAAVVAGVLAVFQAVAAIVAASVLLAQQSRCADVNATVAPSQLFKHQLKVHYFQDASCEYNGVLQEGIMEAGELYVWLIIIIAFSGAWLLASICLLMAIERKATEYFSMVAHTWGAATAAVVVVDAAVSVLLGLDFNTLSRRLADIEPADPSAYGLDLLRLGSLLLMTLALKGFVLFGANVGYTVVIIMAGIKAKKLALAPEHSVHSRGPLSAFTTGQINRAYADIEDVLPHDFTSSSSFDRSNSWHHSRTGSERPFSYLEEPRGRQEPAPKPWDLPPRLPAPDYSPPSARRLKSALKPAQ